MKAKSPPIPGDMRPEYNFDYSKAARGKYYRRLLKEGANVVAVFLLVLTVISEIGAQGRSPLPAQGIVPDEATAVKIAEAVFPPIFGAEEVAKFSPYHAQLKDGVWTVYGTLKPNSRGGTPMMRMRKQDAKVLEVWHSQ